MKILLLPLAGAILFAQRVIPDSDVRAAYESSNAARARLAAKDYPGARKVAAETYSLVQDVLKRRRLDADSVLPLALGAAIEVQCQAMNAEGRKSEALVYLRDEMDKYAGTSIVMRLRKNLHLISLEGKSSPILDVSAWVGDRPQPLSRLKGKPVVLFFWAHWCGDCKSMAPILARLANEYAGRVTFVGPTSHYGYVARGREARPEEETAYIDQIRRQFYDSIGGFTVPLVDENLVTWGASTTPTVVLLDKAGMVRLYHPGSLAYEELQPKIEALLAR